MYEQEFEGRVPGQGRTTVTLVFDPKNPSVVWLWRGNLTGNREEWEVKRSLFENALHYHQSRLDDITLDIAGIHLRITFYKDMPGESILLIDLQEWEEFMKETARKIADQEAEKLISTINWDDIPRP